MKILNGVSMTDNLHKTFTNWYVILSGGLCLAVIAIVFGK